MTRQDKGKELLVEDSLSETNFPALQPASGKAFTAGQHQFVSSPPQWRQLFTQLHRHDERLSFHEPKEQDGVCIVEPPDEVFEIGVKRWSNTLVGYFVGKRIPFKVVKEQLEKKWRKWGAVQVVTADNGNFLFKFDNNTSCDQVLSNGPWEVWGAYLALKRWEEGMSLCKDSFTSIPVWVKLANVPSELWTRPGLSYVASALGVPLCMDAATSAGNRLSFARVCVEMKASSSFPNSFKVRRRNGTLSEVMVQYVWKPSVCSVCRVFDHSSKQCHLVERKEVTEQVDDGQGGGCEVVPGEISTLIPGDGQALQAEEENHELEQSEGSPLRVEEPAVAPQDIPNTIVGKVNPTTPLKNLSEAVLSPRSASPDPDSPSVRPAVESGKRRKKKKRGPMRRGPIPSR
ncbi:DUF4283 domain-containing protein [Cephalotus follicularis]|uniref:DUF4283 domain-containing protein n=1 Tax=Cephalotus follicularis TaxID=3775 RepID=A0A1Q3CTI7_CEPFO|nr:DUF4283 domain-containing protein [Cephalotus follicularis]